MYIQRVSKREEPIFFTLPSISDALFLLSIIFTTLVIAIHSDFICGDYE